MLRARIRHGFRAWARTAPASSRHEIVLALAVASIMSGLGSLFGPDLRPLTIQRFIPHPISLLWYVVLIGGGVGLLVSAAWPNRLKALAIEWPSYLLLGTASLVYGVCLIGPGRGAAFVAATGYLFYSAACLTRTTRIVLYVNHLRCEEDRRQAIDDA